MPQPDTASLVTSDGSNTLVSAKYGVSYHSRHGAVTESAHVFIGAGLLWKAQETDRIAVLEVGFGTGLNAFMTWLEAERRGLSVEYTGLETEPVGSETLAAMRYPEALGLPGRAADFELLHQIPWGQMHQFSAHFQAEKRLLPAQEITFEDCFDVIYFDAFAPQAQPEMWEEGLFQLLAKALKKGGCLVTYCAQGEFRRRLKRSGFLIEKLPGPPGKREMTRGRIV
jgi:tRNA U34 5-methylaminomethyl-2-thiouridine-forming methyltransferase MnmC